MELDEYETAVLKAAKKRRAAQEELKRNLEEQEKAMYEFQQHTVNLEQTHETHMKSLFHDMEITEKTAKQAVQDRVVPLQSRNVQLQNLVQLKSEELSNLQRQLEKIRSNSDQLEKLSKLKEKHKENERIIAKGLQDLILVQRKVETNVNNDEKQEKAFKIREAVLSKNEEALNEREKAVKQESAELQQQISDIKEFAAAFEPNYEETSKSDVCGQFKCHQMEDAGDGIHHHQQDPQLRKKEEEEALAAEKNELATKQIELLAKEKDLAEEKKLVMQQIELERQVSEKDLKQVAEEKAKVNDRLKKVIKKEELINIGKETLINSNCLFNKRRLEAVKELEKKVEEIQTNLKNSLSITNNSLQEEVDKVIGSNEAVMNLLNRRQKKQDDLQLTDRSQ